MDYLIEDEIEFEKKNQIKPVIKECIYELLERFWILREDNEELFFTIKDNEPEIKKYFRDTFRYRLISNHKLIKLEKIPVQPKEWMGEKNVDNTSIFRTQQDYMFCFLLLAFLEGKNDDQQFTLQDICDYLEIQENGDLVWKEGRGYQNRLSLVRVMKFASKIKLILVVDQDIEDFATNSEHDVLLQRTPYSSHFVRIFKEDVTSWGSLDDFLNYLEKENNNFIDRKHRYHRRLFLEPAVHHKDISEDEWDYIKNYYTSVDNNIYRHSDFLFERYKNVSMLIKGDSSITERVFPSDSMIDKVILSFSNFIYENQLVYPVNYRQEIELTPVEIDNIFSFLKSQYRKNWTKKFKQLKTEQIRYEIVDSMKKWGFIEVRYNNFYLKESLFRIIGDFSETEAEEV